MRFTCRDGISCRLMPPQTSILHGNEAVIETARFAVSTGDFAFFAFLQGNELGFDCDLC